MDPSAVTEVLHDVAPPDKWPFLKTLNPTISVMQEETVNLVGYLHAPYFVQYLLAEVYCGIKGYFR
jgi:hypothetical protein